MAPAPGEEEGYPSSSRVAANSSGIAFPSETVSARRYERIASQAWLSFDEVQESVHDLPAAGKILPIQDAAFDPSRAVVEDAEVCMRTLLIDDRNGTGDPNRPVGGRLQPMPRSDRSGVPGERIPLRGARGRTIPEATRPSETMPSCGATGRPDRAWPLPFVRWSRRSPTQWRCADR